MRRKLYLVLLAFLGTICVMKGQKSYDFRDGSIINNGGSEDGTLVLNGGSLHGSTYGLNMKAGGKITIAVDGSSTLKFWGSQHSSLNLTGSTADGTTLGTQYTKVATDLADTYDFVYSGAANTLEFVTETKDGGGSDLYLPLITVIPAQSGKDINVPEKNIIYYYDFCDGSIVPTDTDGKSDLEKGLISIKVGTSNAYQYNGAQHGTAFKTGNQIVLQVAGNSYIKVGGCQYSNGTMTVSAANGTFEQTSLSSQTASCYHQDGSTVDFLYAGGAGTVTIDFTGTNYIPYIEVVPVPFDVELIPWEKKAGTVTINGVDVSIASGAVSTDAASVSVSKGTVISATEEMASIRINLGGTALKDIAMTYSGDISGISVSGDTLLISYINENTKPYGYKIYVSDDSKKVSAEPGKTYSYNFFDGSVLPQTSYQSLRYKTFISGDGILTINSNTNTESLQFGYHDAAHGSVMFSGNSMDIIVAGNAIISFGTCQYGSAGDAVFIMTDESGTVLGSVQAKENEGSCSSRSFSYTGKAGVLTATLTSAGYPTTEIYIHSVSVENEAEIVRTTKTDVWDFGAAQLDDMFYNNMLTEDIINSWYPGVEPGTEGKPLPGGFTAGVLSWVGGTNSDRIRTSNTNLTRYDSNSSPAGFDGITFTGNLYVNASAAVNRYLGLTLSEDDEVTIYAKSQNGAGKLTFEFMGDNTQKDVTDITNTLGVTKFVAKKAGSYHIYDSADKPFYYRILRKDATYVTLSGSLNIDEAPGIPSSYSLVLTNEAGKKFVRELTSGSTDYSIQLPSGYTYMLSLGDANGYIITNGTSLAMNANTTHDIVVRRVVTNRLSGSIEGLNSNLIQGADLIFTPEDEDRIFVPVPAINKTDLSYSVDIEPNCNYTISATGINDYYITNEVVNIAADTDYNIVFALKPTYKIDIDASGLNAEQASKLNIVFKNLNEPEYSYAFTDMNNIYLRDGVYSITCSGLDEYPLQLGATSNLRVNGSTISKELAFKAVTNWPFNDAVISNGVTTAYKGMLFDGPVYNEIAKGHLVLKDAATVKVPVNPGEKLLITYYYSAKFTVDGGDVIETASGSTSKYEVVEYVYTGSATDYVTIRNVEGTTYITDVTATKTVVYSPVIAVGPDKEYQTINDALSAVRAMNRPGAERVKIMVDPGNYEEMLLVDIDNVSIINASVTPSIALKNKGVDIDGNAVRITSYYGHGYNYYSMGTDQKWSEDALRVNKENGYTTYSNTGSGTGNGSYWNATVVVTAKGFEAYHIIFENSFNQYISVKESEDIVEEWASGGKGTRPTDYGNTSVQNKSFVERAAAIAYTAGGDKSILYKCRIIGRQDSFYGAEGARIVTYKGSLMGGTDYLFGGMTLVAYKSDLAMNTSEASADVSYITAAQQNSARGYLLYNCTVTSAVPGTETASEYLSKPGYFGRPWQATTSEAVFYNTTIKATNNPSYAGKSMISPVAWLNTLGGESNKCYEYGTVEESGENNSASRASWSHILTAPTLNDGTVISTYNFTKGSDNWDPIPALIEKDVETAIDNVQDNAFSLIQNGNMIEVSGIGSVTTISIYGANGLMNKHFSVSADTQFSLNRGFWIIRASNAEGQVVLKTLIP